MATDIAEWSVETAAAPVQISGTLTDGRAFFFHSRWESWQLHFVDPDAAFDWDHPAVTGADSAASWLSEDEALALIRTAISPAP